MNDLFKLRGSLTSRQNIILTIAGVLLLLGFWAILAQIKSKVRVTQIDKENLEIADRTYYDSDSMIVADDLILIAKPNEELAKLGLFKKRVYPMLPSPMAVLASFKELHYEDALIINSFQSIRLNFLGYLVAIGISIPFGFALGLIPLFRGLFSKIVDSFRFIPLTAVTGIFIIWLGMENQMKVSFLAFGIIVYLIPVVVQRINEVEEVYLKTVFTLGATNWQTIRSVYFPAVISKLSDDIRVLTAISWTYITIAEMLNRNGGIGDLIWIARRQSRIDKAFAVLIVIVLIGILQDRIFLWLDRIFFSYKYVGRSSHK
jgi:NitT/TauT family transport system permease protein